MLPKIFDDKKHKLNNNFSEETRELFIWNNKCWVCGMSHADCLHHILGRISKSPLNAAHVGNFICHIGNGKLSQFNVESMLLKKTLKFLLVSEYRLTDEDKEFLEKHKRYYD